ncbi:MAG: hypothetical protein HY719_16515 [Planctomycetes bacterium]|nr:hypothetical protein [Planctomycetota bacterium]
MTSPTSDYFRRDKPGGVTPPNLALSCAYAERIVRARGKKTPFTSVSLDPSRTRPFGDQLYKLLRKDLMADGHELIEHEALLSRLRDSAAAQEKAERLRSVRAMRLARKNREGLVQWNFDIVGVERKDLIGWAGERVQKYFSKV